MPAKGKTKLKNAKRVLLLRRWRCWLTRAVFRATAVGNKLPEVSVKNTCLCLEMAALLTGTQTPPLPRAAR